MLWYLSLGAAAAAVILILLMAGGRFINPYSGKNQPGEAPPCGTRARELWRRIARRGPGPGSPLGRDRD